MAEQLGTAVLELRADGSKLRSDMESERRNALDTMDRMGRKMATVGAGLTAAVTGPVLLAGDRMVTSASDLAESVNAIQVVFGDAADDVLALSDAAAETAGLSKRAFNEMATGFSSFAQTVAGEGGDVAGTVDDLTRRVADFASVHNLDVEEAGRVFQSSLAGETEAIRRFGGDLSAATVEQHALDIGLIEAGETMTEQQKVQARYSQLMSETSAVAGDFVNTSDQLANKQRKNAAEAENAAAAFGQKLLPIKERLVDVLSRLVDWFNDLTPAQQDMIVKIALVAAAVGPLLLVLGTLLTSLSAIAGALAAVSLPIVAVVAVVGGLVAALLYLWRTNEGFRDTVLRVWAAVRQAFAMAVAFLTGVLTAFVNWAKGWWDRWGADIMATARKVWDQVLAVIGAAVDAIGAVIGAVLAVVQALWRTWGSTILAVGRRIFDTLANVVENVWSTIKQVFSGALTFLKGIFDIIAGIFTGDWSRLWEGVKGVFVGIWQTIEGVFGGIVDTVIDVFHGLVASIGRVIGDVVARITDPIVNLASDMWGMGRDIVQGLIDGIVDFAGNAVDAVVDTVRSIKDAALGFLGISSPSKVFADEVGAPMMEGTYVGFQRAGRRLSGPMGDALSPSRFTPSMASSAGAGHTHPIYLDGQEVSETLGPVMVGQIRSRTGL